MSRHARRGGVPVAGAPKIRLVTPLAAAVPGSRLALAVTGLVLLAAVAHAAWNAIAHDIADKLVAFTLVGLGGGACAVPLAVLARPPAPASWPYLGSTCLMHVGADLLLMRAYRLGPFSQMYPLARGTSPLLVTLLAAVV